MESLVLKAIERYSLIDKSHNVTVALSGGADSVSLLNVLVSLKDKLNINVSAAHLNHMIRGEEADRDEKFDTAVYATSGLETDAYCLIVLHSDYGKVRIIFNPNESTREAIAQEFPFTLRTRLNKDAK